MGAGPVILKSGGYGLPLKNFYEIIVIVLMVRRLTMKCLIFL